MSVLVNGGVKVSQGIQREDQVGGRMMGWRWIVSTAWTEGTRCHNL